MPLVNVARAADLPPGEVVEVFVGSHPYAICNVEGVVYALDGVCIHHGGPLGQGHLDGTHLACPYHLWEFDCRSGERARDPARRVATYPVRIDDGRIFIEVP
ncbi:MAG: Rieske 2Fe-2S domain-containing protein [Bryobacteraceae bacterium]